MKEQRDKKGITKGIIERQARLLGPLEHIILDTLWSNGWLSGKEVYTEVIKSRKIALTTVLTVLERLKQKGIVTRRKGSSVYLYTHAYNRDEFARIASHNLFRDIIKISPTGATASFVDMLAISDPDGLDSLVTLIENKKKGLKRAKS